MSEFMATAFHKDATSYRCVTSLSRCAAHTAYPAGPHRPVLTKGLTLWPSFSTATNSTLDALPCNTPAGPYKATRFPPAGKTESLRIPRHWTAS